MPYPYKEESPPVLYEFISYLDVERGYSNMTIYNYFIELRMFFRYMKCEKEHIPLDSWETVDITSINLPFIQACTRQDIVGFLSWVTLEKGNSGSARNRKLAVLKSFYHFLMVMDYSSDKVMMQIFSTKTPKTLPKYLEEESIEALLSAINGIFWIRDTAIILLMLSAGLRVSEVASLNLASIKADSVSVLGKGNKERQVYLSQSTQESLEEYLAVRPPLEEPALFLSQRNRRLTVRSIQASTQKYLKKIGKDDYSCHHLRHTAATQLMKQEVNLREIQEILGHESIQTTSIYTHVSNEDLRQVAKNMKY